MVGELRRFQSRQALAKRELASELGHQLALFSDEEIPPHERETVCNFLHRIAHPNSERPFLGKRGWSVITCEQTEAVWQAIGKLSSDRRPQQVKDAFMLVLLYLRHDTLEVMLSRREMAEKLGTEPRNVSSVMRTLEDMEVVYRSTRPIDGRRGPGAVVWKLNPYVAWKGRMDAWERECARTSPPSLKLARSSEAGE